MLPTRNEEVAPPVGAVQLAGYLTALRAWPGTGSSATSRADPATNDRPLHGPQ